MPSQLPRDYPFSPPALTVVTPCYHYAVSSPGGKLCLPTLFDRWSPAYTVALVLKEAEELLFSPSTFDPTADLAQR